jgi:hypothetical protein
MFETELYFDGSTYLLVQVHNFPHLNEVATIWGIVNYGTAEWVKRCCDHNILRLGFGGAWADDHRFDHFETEKKKTNCFSVVMDSMALPEVKHFEHLRRYLSLEDKNRSKTNSSLAHVLWIMHIVWPEQEAENINWALSGLDWKVLDRNDNFSVGHIASLIHDRKQGGLWLNRAERALERYQCLFMEGVAELKKIRCDPQLRKTHFMRDTIVIGEKEWPIIGIQSDNPQMSAVLRSSDFGYRAGIVVKRDSFGHYYVSVNERVENPPELDQAIAVIRVLEQRMAKIKEKKPIQVRDWLKLRHSGIIEGVPEWYYFKEGNMLLNGSIIQREVPPSRLSLKEVFRAVYLGVSPKLFNPKLATFCEKGLCKGSKECVFYDFGLNRCQTVRQLNRLNSRLLKVAA